VTAQSDQEYLIHTVCKVIRGYSRFRIVIPLLVLQNYIRNPEVNSVASMMSPAAFVQPEPASPHVQDPWILHQETLRQLYIVENKTLKEVKATMEVEGVIPSRQPQKMPGVLQAPEGGGAEVIG